MPKAKKTSQPESSRTKAKKAAKAAPKKAARKKAAAPKKAAKKAPAAPAPKKAAKKAPAAPAPKKAAKKAPAAPAPKKAAKKAAAVAASTEQAAAPKKVAKKAARASSSEPVAAAPKKTAKKTAAAAPQTGGSEHDAAIARIEAKAAAAGVELAAGASAKAIKAAEKALGAALPAEAVAFYRRHDGSEDDAAVEGRELLSLSRMVGEWKIWKDLLDQGTFEANDHGRPDPGVQQKWWIAEWVPVTYDGAGNHHVLDLAPAEGGARGQILSFWHDDDPRTVVAKDFLTWLEGASWGSEGDYARDLDVDDDGDDGDDGDDDEPDEAAGDERRFEMDQKFWAIRLDGDSFTVRFGKLGTEGQEQTKSFDDEDAARKEHDKLVAAKTKKGYREV